MGRVGLRSLKTRLRLDSSSERREKVLTPDVVVITEPTNLGVYRGHRGRMEIEVRTRGLSCHGSAPERGINAVYKMAPIVGYIERLNDQLAEGADPFLGKGSVTIAEIRSTSPSLCAVADSCTIHLDRRLTRGETLDSALAQVASLPSVQAAGGSFALVDSMAEAFEGADMVYPKSWAPAAIMRERTRLLRAGETAGLAQLERDALATNARFKDWECSEVLMRRTLGGQAVYMHCLREEGRINSSAKSERLAGAPQAGA